MVGALDPSCSPSVFTANLQSAVRKLLHQHEVANFFPNIVNEMAFQNVCPQNYSLHDHICFDYIYRISSNSSRAVY